MPSACAHQGRHSTLTCARHNQYLHSGGGGSGGVRADEPRYGPIRRQSSRHKRADDVARPERDELAVRADAVPEPARVLLRRDDAVEEADDGDQSVVVKAVC